MCELIKSNSIFTSNHLGDENAESPHQGKREEIREIWRLESLWPCINAEKSLKTLLSKRFNSLSLTLAPGSNPDSPDCWRLLVYLL